MGMVLLHWYKNMKYEHFVFERYYRVRFATGLVCMSCDTLTTLAVNFKLTWCIRLHPGRKLWRIRTSPLVRNAFVEFPSWSCKTPRTTSLRFLLVVPQRSRSMTSFPFNHWWRQNGLSDAHADDVIGTASMVQDRRSMQIVSSGIMRVSRIVR